MLQNLLATKADMYPASVDCCAFVLRGGGDKNPALTIVAKIEQGLLEIQLACLRDGVRPFCMEERYCTTHGPS